LQTVIPSEVEGSRGINLKVSTQAGKPGLALARWRYGRDSGAALRSGMTANAPKQECRIARPSGIPKSAIEQKLNCALPFRFSLSLGFFRFQGLNGISEIPKNFGLSRRPIQSLIPR
jgi:hypothetical protein